MRIAVFLGSFALLSVPSATAQTKVSGTIDCGKPDKAETMQIGDRPNHAFMISQGKCTWSKGLDFGVAQTKEATFTSSSEITGERMSEHGFSVETLSNGDTMSVRTQATGTMKGNDVASDGKWTILGGKGKARGLKGSGTYKCKGTPESVSCDVEGEYQAAAPAAPAKKK